MVALGRAVGELLQGHGVGVSDMPRALDDEHRPGLSAPVSAQARQGNHQAEEVGDLLQAGCGICLTAPRRTSGVSDAGLRWHAARAGSRERWPREEQRRSLEQLAA
jgi:hypothetical protein